MRNLKTSKTLSGQKIRDTRVARGLKLEDLAKLASISEAHLLTLEWGYCQYSNAPRIINNIDTLSRICNVLNIPLYNIFELVIKDFEAAGLLYHETPTRTKNFSKSYKDFSLLHCKYRASLKIRQARLEKGLDLQGASELLHINKFYFTKLELGDYGAITTISFIINVCYLLDIPYSELISLIFQDLKHGKLVHNKWESNLSKLLLNAKDDYTVISFSPSYQKKLENGQIEVDSLTKLCQIAKEYRIPVIDVFDAIAADLGYTSSDVRVILADSEVTYNCNLMFGKLIRSARLNKKMYSSVAAKELGIGYRNYLALEYGKRGGKLFIPNNVVSIIKLCSLFDIPYMQALIAIYQDAQYISATEKATSN